MILEYLGGIETEKQWQLIQPQEKILEYLGGIETRKAKNTWPTVGQDFRIPRRD